MLPFKGLLLKKKNVTPSWSFSQGHNLLKNIFDHVLLHQYFPGNQFLRRLYASREQDQHYHPVRRKREGERGGDGARGPQSIERITVNKIYPVLLFPLQERAPITSDH